MPKGTDKSGINPFNQFYRRSLWEAERNKWERTFDMQILHANLPKPLEEYQFSETRLWRFDRAWPDRKLAVELEGALWVKGAHSTPSGILRDIEKYNAATLLGWRVLRFGGVHLKSSYAIDSVKRAFGC